MNELPRFRVFNSTSIDRFGEQIADVSWDDVIIHNDPELAYQFFIASFSSVFNRYFPLVSRRTKKSCAFSKPWFTPGLHKSALTKNRLYKKFIRNPSPLNIANYKKYRKNITI